MKTLKKFAAALLALALIIVLIPRLETPAEAKTGESASAENVFFYASSASGEDVLLAVMPFSELAGIAHGQLTGGVENGQSYYYSYTDNFPAVCYTEAKGFTLPELVNHVAVRSGAQLTYADADTLQLMATDSGGSYTKSWSYNALYGETRYYFPAMLDPVSGWNLGWEVGGADVAKNGVTLEEYNSLYKSTDTFYSAKAAALASAVQAEPVLATASFGGRVADGALAGTLNSESSLQLCLPITEADLMSAHRTGYDNFKWIYNVRLVMESLPAISSQGNVAAPTARAVLSADGNSLTLTMSCETSGAALYYSIDNAAPQTLYTGPVVLDVTGRDLATDPVTYYMTAVKEGWSDAGVVSGKYFYTAPAFQTVYDAYTGSPLTFTANASVSDADWMAWTAALSGVFLKTPAAAAPTLVSPELYAIDNVQRTITLNASLFTERGSFAFTFKAAEYADKLVSATLRGTLPTVTTAPVYYMGEAITLNFDDESYQTGMTVAVTPPGESASYSISSLRLNRDVAGQLTIKAAYFSASNCKITAPGVYTLTLTNSAYTPNSQEVRITVAEAPPQPDFLFSLAASNSTPATGENVTVTLSLAAAADFSLYGGQYSLTFDASKLALDESSVASSWNWGVSEDESGMATLTFAALDPTNAGILASAQSTLATFTLNVRKAGALTLTPVSAVITDAAALKLRAGAGESLTLTATGEDISERLLGDANGDGVITVADARTIMNHVAGLSVLTGEALSAADANSDGSVTVADARTIMNYVAGLISALG